MQPANRHDNRAKISTAKFRYVLRLFTLDLTTSAPARLTGLSVRSVNALYLRMCRRLLTWCPVPAELDGAIGLDESYSGPQQARGKRSCGTSGKTSVCGLFKRGGQVDTETVPSCSKNTLPAIIRSKIDATAMVNTDGWHGYDGLVDTGFDRHFRVRHGQDEFVPAAPHINGIKSFRSFAKARLQQFKCLPQHTFLLHLKESGFHFNQRQ